MAKFEIVSSYEDKNISLPVRKTRYSAGYDFEVAEDIIVPSARTLLYTIDEKTEPELEDLLFYPERVKQAYDLETMAEITKNFSLRPTLVPTGIKCKLDKNTFLQLSVRSSCPLKYWLVLANGVG